MWFIFALGQQLGKASEIIRNEKKKEIKNWSSKKVVSQFSLAISIWSYPKAVRNLRIGKPYCAPRADKGEGGAFVVDDGQLVWCEGNINMLGDMVCGN